jgi:hypothetical protein
MFCDLQASAHVQYNGFISNNSAISQGVGQGRVICAWFFSLYINDLISELKAVNSGISISDLNIPAILLADDCRFFFNFFDALFVLSVVLTDRVINVPAYTCSFLFSMNVSPSRTEISESWTRESDFCLVFLSLH